MRVLSVIHYPSFGGPHNRNAAVIPVMREHGVETTVLLPDEPGNAADRLRAEGLDVVCIPLSRLRAVRDPSVHLRFVRQFRADVRRLRRLIRELEIDLVLVNGLVNPHAAVAAHLEDTAIVWQLLDTFAPTALRRALMPMVTGISDVIMSTGRAVAAAHPGAHGLGERLVFFYPAADTSRFVSSPESRQAARQRLGLDPRAVVIGSVGNINPMKGHDTFLQAAARVRRVHPDAQFVILGSQSERHDAYRTELWQLASALGLQVGRELVVMDPGADVAKLAPAFDLFWLTSNPRSEGIPTVIGEAMALQLPVVATRVGSVHEAVEEGVTGRLVAPRDPAAIAEATLPYVEDEQLRQVVGRAARARAEALYAPAECAQRHQAAFEMARAHRDSRTHARPSSNGAGR
jgi:glycosyltransferase involved in cell wall biosynthesis